MPLAVLAALAASAAWAAAVAAGRTRRERIRLALPAVAMGMFLAMYLPHSMAALKVSRYVIPLWTLWMAASIGAPLASPRPALKCLGWGIFAVWLLYHGAGDVLGIVRAAEKRAGRMVERLAVVEAALAAGLKTATVAGSDLAGYEGSIYSFSSGGRVAFVNPYRERHLPSAILAECDDRSGILVGRQHAPWLKAALADIGARWDGVILPGHVLLHDVMVPPRFGAALPGRRVRLIDPADASPDDLSDRRASTVVRGSFGAGRGVVLELDCAVEVCGLQLVDADTDGEGLPRDLRAVAIDDLGREVEVRPSRRRVAAIWTAGPRVWVMGSGAHMECRFAPTTARRIRMEMLEGRDVRRDRRGWSIAEVYVMATRPPPSEGPSRRGAERLAAMLEERGVDFVAADRWMASRIEERAAGGGRLRSWPRRNSRYPSTLIPTEMTPRVGLAVAVESAWAEDATHVLASACPRARWERVDAAGYTAFLCADPGPRETGFVLEWRGSFLWRCDDPVKGPR